MQTKFIIDEYRKTRFIVDSLRRLFEEAVPGSARLHRAPERLPELER